MDYSQLTDEELLLEAKQLLEEVANRAEQRAPHDSEKKDNKEDLRLGLAIISYLTEYDFYDLEKGIKEYWSYTEKALNPAGSVGALEGAPARVSALSLLLGLSTKVEKLSRQEKEQRAEEFYEALDRVALASNCSFPPSRLDLRCFSMLWTGYKTGRNEYLGQGVLPKIKSPGPHKTQLKRKAIHDFFMQLRFLEPKKYPLGGDRRGYEEAAKKLNSMGVHVSAATVELAVSQFREKHKK